jgi:hypothetical protein
MKDEPIPMNTRPTFRQSINAYEAQLISAALKEADNNLVRTAGILGFNSYQSLCSLLNGRHKALRPKPKQNRPYLRGQGEWVKEAL